MGVSAATPLFPARGVYRRHVKRPSTNAITRRPPSYQQRDNVPAPRTSKFSLSSLVANSECETSNERVGQAFCSSASILMTERITCEELTLHLANLRSRIPLPPEHYSGRRLTEVKNIIVQPLRRFPRVFYYSLISDHRSFLNIRVPAFPRSISQSRQLCFCGSRSG